MSSTGRLRSLLTRRDRSETADPASVAGGDGVPNGPASPSVEPPEGPSLDESRSRERSAAGAECEGVEVGEQEIERRRAALAELFDLMRPAVQMDGGDLALVDADYVKGIVEVELQGACGSCAISATTLQGGVERLLRERLDWVTEVRGGVDESIDPFESAAMGRGGYVPRYY